MKIQINIKGQATILTASLESNSAGKAFYELLPLELELTDYNHTEKVTDLPESLPEEGATSGMAPRVGDIAYFAPWGNLAIFYKDFRHSRGLVKLGRINGDVNALTDTENLTVYIKPYEKSEN